MATLKVEYPKDLLKLVGRELGPSEWVTVDQAMIDKFADATGDHQWIHVDVDRAKREMPGGKTIAHGYLTLSLVPRMASTLLEVTHRSRGINYGSNKVRFISPVPAGGPPPPPPPRRPGPAGGGARRRPAPPRAAGGGAGTESPPHGAGTTA